MELNNKRNRGSMKIEEKFFKEFEIGKIYRECSQLYECTYGISDKCEIHCNFKTPLIHPPVTAEIVLGLEEIALDNDFILTKIPNPYQPLEKDYYLWQDSTNMNRLIRSMSCKTRIEAILELCIALKLDITQEVQQLFGIEVKG